MWRYLRHVGNEALSRPAVRIALVGVPGLTADLVKRCVLGQSDITIVRELRNAGEFSHPAFDERIDVVLTALTADGVPSKCQQILFGNQGVPVIAVSSDGQVEVYDRRVLREAALSELLAEIRRVASTPVRHR